MWFDIIMYHFKQLGVRRFSHWNWVRSLMMTIFLNTPVPADDPFCKLMSYEECDYVLSRNTQTYSLINLYWPWRIIFCSVFTWDATRTDKLRNRTNNQMICAIWFDAKQAHSLYRLNVHLLCLPVVLASTK